MNVSLASHNQALRLRRTLMLFNFGPLISLFSFSLQAESNSSLAVKAAAVSVASYRGPTTDADQLAYTMVNGVRLAYRLEGAGISVVFVHGEGYSHELWTEQIAAFCTIPDCTPALAGAGA